MQRVATALISLLGVLLLTLLGGCATPQGESAADKREYVQRTVRETLAEAYQQNPALRGKLQQAAGYGVFSNVGTKLLMLSTGHGFGLVHDNATGEETYMRMAEVGAGLGAGVKRFRAVLVFHHPQTLRHFVERGWDVGADIGVAAKTDQQGTQGSLGASLQQDIEIYQFTEQGLELAATLAGTKYWKDPELNAGR
jgi:lipid-binding SYLF domain-containing protein